METEKKRHETEDSLVLAQFGKPRNISNKLQNGGQSTERDTLQVPGETNWNHYKPSPGANPMKRHKENCNSPGLFDEGTFMMNGDLKHALSEKSLLAHQTKKLRVDSEMKGNDDMSSSLTDNFSELTKVAKYEFNDPQTDLKLEKSNCAVPNGDVFHLPRNNGSITNGAGSPPSTIESTPGDLLEKTLSQYYPEQVSIAPQTSGTQLNAVNGSLANKLPSEGAQPPSLTSGLTLSVQQSNAPSNDKGGSNYNSAHYVINGYPNNVEAEHQQQHLRTSYSGQELSLGQLPGMIPPTNTATSSQQHKNALGCYPENTNPRGLYEQSNQHFNHEAFMEINSPLGASEGGGYEPFPNATIQKIRQHEETASNQHQQDGLDRGLQLGLQSRNFQQNTRNTPGADSMSTREGILQQTIHGGLENGIDNSLFSTSDHQSWIEQNPSHSKQQTANGTSSQAQQQDMWRGMSSKPHQDQQSAKPQVHGQLWEANMAQSFQTQKTLRENIQESNSLQQQRDNITASINHNTAPEWHQSNPNAPQMQQSQPQNMSDQRIFNQSRQTDSHYHTPMQSEHLCEDPDLQDILSSGFSAPQQQQHSHHQRPLSHPPQFEEHQVKSPNYRPHSQPQPSQQQLQPNQPLRNNSAHSINRQTQHGDHAAFSPNKSSEMQLQHPRQYSANSGSSNLKQFPPQRPTNNCHQSNHTDYPPTSIQSQPHLQQDALNQHISTKIYPKAEHDFNKSCTQFQRGSRLPLGPVGPNGDFQRHAALRMHLLQRQERAGPPHPSQSTTDPRQGLNTVKIENGLRFELPCSKEAEQQLQMRDNGGMQIKQENQLSLCEPNKTPGSILASMEQSLRQYQLSPVFEKKSLVISSSNGVKVESSGSVTILSSNTDLGKLESSGSAPPTVVLKKPPDSTPKKEYLLQSFMESPMKLLDTPIKNLLDTPLKTQYDIASCHCVGESPNVVSKARLISLAININ